MMCGLKLTVEPLSLELDKYFINILPGMWLPIHAGIKVKPW